MAGSEDVFSEGFSAGSYSENPYDEDSAEFDQFERGRTQAIKKHTQNNS